MANIKAIKGTDNVQYNLRDDYSKWGGENLFNYTGLKIHNQELQLNNYQNTGSFTQFNNSLIFDPSITVGERYTVSFDAISPNGDTAIQLYNSNGNPKYFNFHAGSIGTVTTSWKHFTKTVINNQYSGTATPSTDTNIWKRIEIYAPSKMGVKIRNVKVEFGDKETDWSPCYKSIFEYNSTNEQLVVNL